MPTDWQVAPGDILASVRAGRLPHLTWGRAILGGVVALSLLFGAAGVYVILRGPTSPLGPAEVGAEGTSSGIAVLPFHVTGPSLDLYREGMVDLMSSNLDGLSGYRAVDSRTVLARWSRDVGEGTEAELNEALKVAAGTGARFAVVGNGVELGSRIRFTADLYDLDTGTKVGSGQAEGAPDDVLGLVDALTVEVMRSLLDATGQGSAGQDLRLASLLTTSVPALRDYLQGDALFRKGQFDEAREALERAVQEDSTFALAHWRLGEAIGWISGIGNPEGQTHKKLAARFGDRLPPREATLLAVSSATSAGRALDELGTLEAYLRRYPDDPDGWYDLGEMGLHATMATGITDDRLEEALYKAVELDPTFGPYYVHALEWASAKGHRERFDSLMAGWERAGEGEEGLERFRIRGAILMGSETERAEAIAALKTKDDQFVRRVGQFAPGELDQDLDRLLPIGEELARGGPGSRGAALDIYFEQGRFREAREIARADSTWQGRLTAAGMVIDRLAMDAADTSDVRVALGRLDGTPPPDLAIGVAFGRAELSAILGERGIYERAVAEIRAKLGADMAGLAAVRDTADVRRTVDTALEVMWSARRGRVEEAYEALEAAPIDDFFSGMLASLAFRARRWADAVKVNEGISRTWPGRSAAKYRLGRAYEELGDRQRALDAYRTFLSRYEKADPDLPWVGEARAAVARLEG